MPEITSDDDGTAPSGLLVKLLSTVSVKAAEADMAAHRNAAAMEAKNVFRMVRMVVCFDLNSIKNFARSVGRREVRVGSNRLNFCAIS